MINYQIICPLCSSNSTTKIETINREQIIYLYKKDFGIDVSYLLKNADLDYYECSSCKLRFFYPLIVGDEKFYNALQRVCDWYYMDTKEEYIYVKNYIKPDDKVLEVGCGKGYFFKHISTKTKYYIGLELNKKAKETAESNGIKVENITVEDYSKKYPETFDVVVSFQVLEHVSDPKGFIEAKIKLLKKGGLLIIAVPSEDSFIRYAANVTLNLPPHHVTRWSDETLKKIAEIYNLKMIDLYHEKVQEGHKVWFITTVLNSLFIPPHRLIDLSLKWKLINKFSEKLARLIKEKLKEELLPNGHTVVCIYKKD